MSCKPMGYYGIPNSIAHLLEVDFGSNLERVTANSKLQLISALADWLRDDEEDLPVSQYVEASSTDQVAYVADRLEDITPEIATALIAALIEQIRSGVYLQ